MNLTFSLSYFSFFFFDYFLKKLRQPIWHGFHSWELKKRCIKVNWWQNEACYNVSLEFTELEYAQRRSIQLSVVVISVLRKSLVLNPFVPLTVSVCDPTRAPRLGPLLGQSYNWRQPVEFRLFFLGLRKVPLHSPLLWSDWKWKSRKEKIGF